ncbi:transmembrane protein 11, mitochondrial-like isoform X3 [Anneissia japonica]|uniref:transmembrane protein 11, mitochondrial-like isoform X2 n=1 Tax=Anneissia japonica TaxID=1529436 RepID=UPI00142599D5|nr:transmembrane protein 11, mitochondrial-like isoform X2 [Anneissia japonica]XP_033100687.1 transmembrane protein 11, mitochondrial-like isoform X3 [Anneissia japonica]
MADKERELVGTDCAIIHEIYDNGHAQEQFELELEQALEAQKSIIIIEPSHIGDETARWIIVGNCLHKMAVLAGVTSLTSPLLLPRNVSNFVCIPMGAISMACALLYGVSWQFDPCCKYQVEYDTRKLSKLPLHTLSTSSPVVLVRKDDKYRKVLHNVISGMTCIYLGYKFYHWFLQ